MDSSYKKEPNVKMKIALIADTHWGVRNDNQLFVDNTKRFLDDIFFPQLDVMGINHVIHLGDLVDRRKYINFVTAKRLREDFLDQLLHRKINMDLIAGNHDVYYKNTNSVNALYELIVGKYNNIIVHTEPTTVTFDQTDILLLPWINDENRQRSIDNIQSTKATIALGHLELAGFQMYSGSMVSHGDDPDIFGRFDLVCSGHYHHKSSSGNIHYLGSHGQFTWSDYEDPRGFHVLDTETKQLTFIENPYKIFKKVWYNDTDKDLQQTLDYDFESHQHTITKVIVTAKNNPYIFDKFIEKLEKSNVHDMQIVEDHLNLNLQEDNDIVNEAESTIDIFKNFIKQVDVSDSNKIKLEQTIVQLYNEALTIQ